MNLKTVENRTLALAAVFQACHLVSDIAKQGKEISEPMLTCLHSLFKVNAESVIDIYGGTNRLSLGLSALAQHLGQGSKSPEDIEVIRYMFALIHLERRLRKRRDLMDILTSGIDKAQQQADYFDSETHPSVIANLADLYQQTVSTLNPKIMVHGEPEILSNPDNANLIRALLLAGMRAVILWRQCGGSRWQLLFGRNKLVQAAEALRRQH